MNTGNASGRRTPANGDVFAADMPMEDSRGRSVFLLLADPSPCLRYRVLTELTGIDQKATKNGAEEMQERCREAEELRILREEDPFFSALVSTQEEDGSWKRLSNEEKAETGALKATSLALSRLALLGFTKEHPVVSRGAEYLFSRGLSDGSWPLTDAYESDVERERYSEVPLQTALPLRGLAEVGYAEDPRAEKAFEWLLSRRLSDGAWPAGIASGVYGRIAGYRKLPHSRWGCASNTIAALLCLAAHPVRGQSEAFRRPLDLLLCRETQERSFLGFDLARTLGAAPSGGFFTYYGRYDPVIALTLASRAGVPSDDPRMKQLLAFIDSLRNDCGLWRHPYSHGLSRWLSYTLLSLLHSHRELSDWFSLEPETPFRNYPVKRKRY